MDASAESVPGGRIGGSARRKNWIFWFGCVGLLGPGLLHALTGRGDFADPTLLTERVLLPHTALAGLGAVLAVVASVAEREIERARHRLTLVAWAVFGWGATTATAITAIEAVLQSGWSLQTIAFDSPLRIALRYIMWLLAGAALGVWQWKKRTESGV